MDPSTILGYSRTWTPLEGELCLFSGSSRGIVLQPSAAQFVTLAFNVYQYDIVRSPTPPNHWDVWWTPLSPVRGKRKRIDQFTVLRPEQKVKYD